MRTRNARQFTTEEAEHLALVKQCACVVTNAPPPSEAHHIRQGDHFTAIALSQEAHTGSRGWHGDKSLWRVGKIDELAALNETLRRVALLKAGKPIPTDVLRIRKRGTDLSSKKQLPRCA